MRITLNEKKRRSKEVALRFLKHQDKEIKTLMMLIRRFDALHDISRFSEIDTDIEEDILKIINRLETELGSRVRQSFE